jgi:Ran GTPase-activating protein (RanGAP) involved in mRNA processing and transport
MTLLDALILLPDLHGDILPANRTFLLCQTSKTMCVAVKNAKLDTIVVRKSDVKFCNGEGLHDKLNGLNAWCRVTVLDFSYCDLKCDGAHAIADVLSVNTTLTELDLSDNKLGEGGGCKIAESLYVNTTLTNLDLSYNGLGEGGAHAIGKALRVNTTLTNLNISVNNLGPGGATFTVMDWERAEDRR